MAELGSPCSIADDALLARLESITSHQRQLDLLKTAWAAEVARRSDHELGYSGLARRKGLVNAESFLGAVTGTTKAEAGKLIRVGE